MPRSWPRPPQRQRRRRRHQRPLPDVPKIPWQPCQMLAWLVRPVAWPVSPVPAHGERQRQVRLAWQAALARLAQPRAYRSRLDLPDVAGSTRQPEPHCGQAELMSAAESQVAFGAVSPRGGGARAVAEVASEPAPESFRAAEDVAVHGPGDRGGGPAARRAGRAERHGRADAAGPAAQRAGPAGAVPWAEAGAAGPSAAGAAAPAFAVVAVAVAFASVWPPAPPWSGAWAGLGVLERTPGSTPGWRPQVWCRTTLKILLAALWMMCAAKSLSFGLPSARRRAAIALHQCWTIIGSHTPQRTDGAQLIHKRYRPGFSPARAGRCGAKRARRDLRPVPHDPASPGR